MSVNSSFASNVTLPPPPPSASSASSSGLFSETQQCLASFTGTCSVSAYTIICLLVLLPLCLLVLHLGLQRWRRQRSDTTMSNSDLLTYHMVVGELMSITGTVLCCFGGHFDLVVFMFVGTYLVIMRLFGQMLFHTLTCVERYLAVVHPITYLSLRKAKGIRIRNIVIGCVWLICNAWPCLMFVVDDFFIDIIYLCLIALTMLVISFCSLSVLRVLIRPGPGDGGGDRQQVDQSKLKAFHTIMAIMGVLLIRFGGNIVATALYNLPQLGEAAGCGMRLSVIWFSLPSSLVLPLLFLHRAGKLKCCKKNSTSGPASD